MKILGIAGYSGSGKTTLIEKLVPILVGEGLRVSLIKHAHHQFEVDQPGKDSYRHRYAGCAEVLVSSSRRVGLMHELRGDDEPTLEEQSPAPLSVRPGSRRGLEARPDPQDRGASRRRRPAAALSRDPHVIAIATDEPLPAKVPQFGLDDAPAIARFILDFVSGRQGRARLASVSEK